MKKMVVTLCVTALTALAANSQVVLGYTLSESGGTYTPLTDPTVIYQGTDEKTDISWYDRSVITPEGITSDGDSAKGFDMGFTFNFAGEEYTSFLVSPFGYLYLGGEDEIKYNTFMRANFLTFFYENGLVGLACSQSVAHRDDTEISYKVNGTGSDASLTLQFSNILCLVSSWGESGVVTDFQLTLTADGGVNYVFNDFRDYISEDEADKYTESLEVPLRIAVREGDNYVCAKGALGDLAESYNSVEEVRFSSATPAGTALRWIVPGDCVAPTNQPTDLIFDRTSDQISYSFTPSSDAQTYLVLYTTSDEQPTAPEDGVVYEAGDKIGEGTVVSYGAATKGVVYSMEPGTDFYFYVYAVGAYGLNGPKYNVESPLKGDVSTLPASPGDVKFSPAETDKITMTVAENGTDDDILVIYNPYCERSNYGDHGLFGPLTPELKQGEVLPVPEDFVPSYSYEGVPMPENGGTVAYVGKPGEITIEGLDPSTMYYISVYTRNSKGEYTSKPVQTGWSTIISSPYDGDSFNFPNYRVPYGWEGSDAGDDTLMVTDEAYYDRATGEPSRGSQIMQVRVINNRGDAINGKRAWITPAPVKVSDRNVKAAFSYSIVEGLNRFQSAPYNEWAEDDKLEIQVSTDNGETWKSIETYDAANHPEQEELTSYNTISADLNAYSGETVLVRLYWNTYMAPAFGGNMYVERFSLTQAESTGVPEVSIGAVTEDSAVVNWIAQQTDYELAYSLKDADDFTVVRVENAMTYTIEGLEANTEYAVKVRGLIVKEESGEESFSEWSDPVCFTTADYPDVDAPEGLVSDVDSKGLDGVAILSWNTIEVAEKYEVAYRLSSETAWSYVESEDATVVIGSLKDGATYIW
ncbi:MAG: fibronectin type III domain-containing protein, partial [Muribaculaceae bacterium]|nr:fibronectin type III domain-containing protein [Muribaculaceae bacterium]